MGKGKQILGTLAALVGMTGAPATAPAAQTQPAVITDTRVRNVLVQPFRASPPTPKSVARVRRLASKRAAKRAYRAARLRSIKLRDPSKRITWREANERASVWAFWNRGHA